MDTAEESSSMRCAELLSQMIAMAKQMVETNEEMLASLRVSTTTSSTSKSATTSLVSPLPSSTTDDSEREATVATNQPASPSSTPLKVVDEGPSLQSASIVDLVVPNTNIENCEYEDTVPVIPIYITDEDHKLEVKANAAVSSSKLVAPSSFSTPPSASITSSAATIGLSTLMHVRCSTLGLNKGASTPVFADLVVASPTPSSTSIQSQSPSNSFQDAPKVFEVMPFSFSISSVGDHKCTEELQYYVCDAGIVLRNLPSVGHFGSRGHKPSKPPWSLVSAFSVDDGKPVEKLLPKTFYHAELRWKPPWVHFVCMDFTHCHLDDIFVMEFLDCNTENRKCMVHRIELPKNSVNLAGLFMSRGLCLAEIGFQYVFLSLSLNKCRSMQGFNNDGSACWLHSPSNITGVYCILIHGRLTKNYPPTLPDTSYLHFSMFTLQMKALHILIQAYLVVSKKVCVQLKIHWFLPAEDKLNWQAVLSCVHFQLQSWPPPTLTQVPGNNLILGVNSNYQKHKGGLISPAGRIHTVIVQEQPNNKFLFSPSSCVMSWFWELGSVSRTRCAQYMNMLFSSCGAEIILLATTSSWVLHGKWFQNNATSISRYTLVIFVGAEKTSSSLIPEYRTIYVVEVKPLIACVEKDTRTPNSEQQKRDCISWNFNVVSFRLVPWDPGGFINGGLGTSRIFRRGGCHVPAWVMGLNEALGRAGYGPRRCLRYSTKGDDELKEGCRGREPGYRLVRRRRRAAARGGSKDPSYPPIYLLLPSPLPSLYPKPPNCL